MQSPIQTAEQMQALERILHDRTCGRIRHLRVESTGDSIVVSGHAPTYYLKQLVTQILLEDSGVRILENEIDVV